WQVVTCAAALTGVTALAFCNIRRYGYFVVGWLWYLGTLVPVIGLIQAGDQSRADRFTYVSLIGLFIIIAWALPEIQGTNGIITFAAASLLIFACAWAARIQVGYWQSKASIWEHSLAVTDESYIAHTNLGIALYEQGKLESAIQHYRAALRLRPDFAE